MYSGTVVLLFIFVLVGLRAVWYCFLVVSGKSSTALAVLYCFLTWYTNLGTLKQKTENGTNVPDPGKLVDNSSVVAFQIARVIRCSVVDMKRTVDMSPLKRIRLRSHAATELKANRSMRAREQAVFVLCLVLPMEAPQSPVLRARERRANVGIAQISGTKKTFFSAVSCLVLMSSQTSVSPQSQGAQTPYHWHCLLAFDCNNHNCYFAFELGAGNISWALRSQGGY